MKSFFASLVIGAMIICGGILFNICINRVSEEFSEKCGSIALQIEKGDFAKAELMANDLSTSMDKKKILLASIINHESIDDIEMCITELCGYAEYGNGTEAMLRCRKLEHLFEHLPSNYGIKSQNIL